MAVKLEYNGLEIEIVEDSDGFPSIKIKTGSYLGDNDRPSIDIILNDVCIHSFLENDYDCFSSERIRQNYEKCECPDCQDDIPFNVIDGDECKNCGHVFYPPINKTQEAEYLEIVKEDNRRDEKNGLYPQHEDVSN